MRGYTQLIQEQRYPIKVLLKAGHNQTEMARVPEVHKLTTSRELKRNRGLHGYRPHQAPCLADSRHKGKVQPRIAAQTRVWVERLLREKWSPEQISSWLTVDKRLFVSHEWIYLYIYENRRRGNLHHHLRCQKAHRKRYDYQEHRSRITGRISNRRVPGNR